jgi:hypothetical protein
VRCKNYVVSAFSCPLLRERYDGFVQITFVAMWIPQRWRP